MSYKHTTGVDWFTATSKESSAGTVWWEKWLEYRETIGDTTLEQQDWRNRWYTGVQIGGLAWGFSERMGYIMIARGSTAAKVWQSILPSATNITRIDLQVTVELKEPRELAQEGFAALPAGMPRKYSLYTAKDGGATLYIGSRNSDQFGRLYDKGVKGKTHAPGLLWRYEVEYKSPRSGEVATQLLKRLANGEDIVEDTVGAVYDWFYTRKVNPEFGRLGRGFVVEVGKRISTARKKLAWLRTQVMPSVRVLIAEGYHTEVYDALGLLDRMAEMPDFKQARFGSDGGENVQER